MATLATRFSKFMARDAEQAETLSAPVGNDGTRIRPFANEDIYFFVKHIDNTAVIRAVDPASERASWKMIGAAAVAAMLLIGVLMPKGYGVLAGYKIQSLRMENQKLLGEQAALELEETSLMSPERMAILAKQQQFIDPAADHIVYLPNQSSDTQVASATSVGTSK